MQKSSIYSLPSAYQHIRC